MPKPVQLRGHHLLCILSYRGAGYTPDFIENFDQMVERLNHGATIEIISGPDDICGALRQGAKVACAHARVCRKESVKARDKMALADIARALQMPNLKAGDTLKMTKGDLRHLRQAFTHGGIRRACGGCLWHQFCTQIASERFAGVKLLAKATP